MWLAFVTAAQTDPALAAVRDQTDRAMFDCFHKIVADLQAAGQVDPSLPTDREAARLHALVDGLAAHRVSHPDRVTPVLMHDVIEAHLDSLAPH